MKDKIQIVKELKEHLISKFGDNIKDVILFGSQAKGTAKEYSDYDVVIILKSDYDWKYKNRIHDIIYDYELDNDILVDMHIISEYELNNTLRGVQPIFIDAINEGIYA